MLINNINIIFIITYDCNYRCKYCDINKRPEKISEKVLEKSINFIEKNNFNINKIKFFGGEPLLEKNKIKYFIENYSKNSTSNFYITTNASLIDENFIEFSKKNNIKLTFSIDGNSKINGENRILNNGLNSGNIIINNTKKYSNFIRVNQVITSKNSKDFFKNFKFIYDLGIREFNFLPAYYKEWSKTGLLSLKKGFDEILKFYKDGNKFKLVNLENYSQTSFFNLGIVIDTDGGIYYSNLVLSDIFEKYKKELIIGSVFEGLFFKIDDEKFILDYINKLNTIIKIEYNNNILLSVKYIDIILNNFCNEFKTYGVEYMKSMQ